MKLLKATFEQIYFTGVQYLNQRMGGEVLLEEGDTMEDAWDMLNNMADARHRKKYPHLYESAPSFTAPAPYSNPETVAPLPIPSIDRKAIEELEIAIDNSKDVAELKGLFDRVQALGNKEVRDFYNQKMSDLA